MYKQYLRAVGDNELYRLSTGLYTVEKYWKAIGFSGFVVYKFALKRCSEQAPSPWLDELQV